MRTATEQSPTSNRDEIAVVAWQIWQQEGCQHGRDLENWLKAEQQFLAASQKMKKQINKAAAKGTGLSVQAAS